MPPLATSPRLHEDVEQEPHETNVEAIPQPPLPTPLSRPLDSPSVSDLAGLGLDSAPARLRCKIPGLPTPIRETACYTLQPGPDDSTSQWPSAPKRSDAIAGVAMVVWAMVMVTMLRRKRHGARGAVGVSAHRIWTLPAEDQSGVMLEDCGDV